MKDIKRKRVKVTDPSLEEYIPVFKQPKLENIILEESVSPNEVIEEECTDFI